MGRRKRRSKQFRDSSKVIDMEQARQERQRRRQSQTTEEEERQAEASPQSSARHVSRKMMLRRRKERRRWAIIGVCALIALMFVVSVGHIIVLKHDLHQARKQQEEYKKEKDQLEKDMAELNDLDYLEEQARDQMRLVKPGETLYIFPEDMTSK